MRNRMRDMCFREQERQFLGKGKEETDVSRVAGERKGFLRTAEVGISRDEKQGRYFKGS